MIVVRRGRMRGGDGGEGDHWWFLGYNFGV